MIAPLQIFLLLLILRLPALLWPPGDGGRSATPSFSLFGHVAGFVPLTSFLVSTAILAVAVLLAARRAARKLGNPDAATSRITHGYDRLAQIARWLTIANTAFHLFGLGLAAQLLAFLAGAPVLKTMTIFAESLLLLPVMAAWLVFWSGSWLMESATRTRTFATKIALGLPAHPVPPLSKFLSMQARHNFYLIIPILLASFMEDLSKTLEPVVPNISAIAIPFTVLALFMMLPWLITQIWSTAPLKGPLRTRLDAIAAQHRLRFRNILIWKTHNAVTNAAILGFVPFARYFLMTDALLESLTDEQIESVFAHEVGHGKHRHLHWYLAFMGGAFLFSGALATFILYFLRNAAAFREHLGGDDAIATVIILLLMLLTMAFAFPRLSHRFEHQADWFASQHMGQSKSRHPEHLPIVAAALVVPSEELDPVSETADAHIVTLEDFIPPEPAAMEQAASESAAPLSATQQGAEIFASALGTLLDLTHRSRDKADWMHPSPNARIALVRKLAADPTEREAFSRKMFFTRLCIALFITVAVASAVIAYFTPDNPPAGVTPDSDRGAQVRSP